MSRDKNSSNESRPNTTPTDSSASSRACPYHTKVLTTTSNAKTKDMNPMERFLAEEPAEQSAVFLREDTGEVSTAKGCTCELDTATTEESK